MEMLCPECLGPLVTEDGKTAKCTLHGGEYRILFQRGQVLVPAAPAGSLMEAAPPASTVVPPPQQADNPYRAPVHTIQTCFRHPDSETEQNCAGCGVAICATCAFPQPDGSQLCPNCVVKTRVLPPAGGGVPAGVMCTRHPEVQADHYCRSCHQAICATCDFALPGGVHVCPDCATRPDRGLSSKRKTLLGWSYALVVWSTVGMALVLSGVFAEAVDDPGEAEAFGIAFSLFVFVPSLIGTALSLSTLDRRLTNPAVIWVAVVWNILVVGVFLLLNVVGLFMMQ